MPNEIALHSNSNVRPIRTQQPVAAPRRSALQEARQTTATDATTVSARARELSLALTAARQAPDIRAERVSALQQRLAAGTYHVPNSLLAQKMLEVTA